MEDYLIEHDDYFVWAVDKNYKRITTLYAWDYYSQYSYIKARDAVMRELKKEMNL